MITKIVLVAGIIILLIWLGKSFSDRPFKYRNVAMTSVLILLMALLVGSMHYANPEAESGSIPFVTQFVGFLWHFSRDLFVPLCFMSLFVAVSNVALLSKEGFRLNNFLGFMFMGVYLTVINVLWFPINEMPAIVTPVLVFLRLLLCYFECTILALCIIGYAVLLIKPSYDKDYVVILGCSISKKGKLRPLLKGRVNRAMRFVWEQEWNAEKTALYVPSGGQGSDEIMSEGSAMEMYLLSHGAEDFEVLPEKESKNTRENLVFSRKIIESKKDDAKVAVVTTNYHVLRSGMLAMKAGLNAQLIGSSTKWYFWPNAFFREMVAILFMHTRVHVIVAVLCAIAAVLMYQ